MKSYNHLYEIYVSEKNIRISIVTGTKNHRDKQPYKDMFENPDDYIKKIRYYAETFEPEEHYPVQIYDGISRKKRIIVEPYPYEQIVHHMVINVLKPIFMKGMYKHSYGSIPKRGGHKGKKVIEKWIGNDPKNVKYCLKADITKYYESIKRENLKKKLKKIIHDEKFLNILYKVIDVKLKRNYSIDEDEFNRLLDGLLLGFYPSQWFGNWYLQDFDHFVKEKLGIKYYIRYMDDIVCFCSNKRKLHKALDEMKEYLSNLDLEFNGKTQIFRYSYQKKNPHYKDGDDSKYKYIDCGRDLDFMGFRFFRYRTILRKSIMLKMTRKARKISWKQKPTIYDMRQMMAYLGWLNATDTYNVYENYIKGIIDFGKYKERISNYDRRRNKNVETNAKQRQCKAA